MDSKLLVLKNVKVCCLGVLKKFRKKNIEKRRYIAGKVQILCVETNDVKNPLKRICLFLFLSFFCFCFVLIYFFITFSEIS